MSASVASGLLTRRNAVAGLIALAGVGLAGGYGVSRISRPKPMRIAVDGGRPPRSPGAGRLVTVHVAGAVQRPGLYRVPEGSRVDDAVLAAGGPAPDADLDALNLAARIRDGDKVVVPARAPPGSQSSGGPASGPGSRVNLNSASESELDALPGVGPAIAQRIVAWRESNGGFRSVRDLLKVPGIGPSKFKTLEELVTV